MDRNWKTRNQNPLKYVLKVVSLKQNNYFKGSVLLNDQKIVLNRINQNFFFESNLKINKFI